MDELTPNEIEAGVLSVPIGISLLGNSSRLFNVIYINIFKFGSTKTYLWDD